MRVNQAKHAKRVAMHKSCWAPWLLPPNRTDHESSFCEAVSHDYPPRAWVHSGTPPPRTNLSSNGNGAATSHGSGLLSKAVSPPPVAPELGRAPVAVLVQQPPSPVAPSSLRWTDLLRGFVTPPLAPHFWCNLGIGTTPSWLNPASMPRALKCTYKRPVVP